MLTVGQSVLRDKVENNERWEEIGDKRKMNPWQFHFAQKLCSWYLGHLHNNGTQVGEEKTRKKPKNTRKILDTIQWTVPTYIINHKKKSKLCVDHQKEMSTEIKTNCDKHRLWHHCSGEKTAEKVFWSCCPFRNPWLSFLVRVCQQQFQQWFVAHCVALFVWKRSISETIQPTKRNFSIKWTNKNLMKDT